MRNVFLFIGISFCLMVGLNAQEYPNVIVEEEVVKQFAPDFEMVMEDGSVKRLSDFRGEVLYISFWASWCGPCIKGFTKYRDMRESIEHLGVVMLNISIDEDATKWRTAINRHQPAGMHAIVSHDVIRDAYQLYNVPRYEIIGKNGQFLYLSQGVNRNILDDFKKFLE